MTKDTNIIFRTDSVLKENVTKIAHERGVTLSQLINACLQDINQRGMVPLYVNKFLPPVYEKESRLTILKIKKIVTETVQKMEKKNLITKVYLYGSYSRGEETSESDVDLRIEAERGLTLIDLGNLRQDLVEAFKKDVDLSAADPEDLDPKFYQNIKKDEICIYER